MILDVAHQRKKLPSQVTGVSREGTHHVMHSSKKVTEQKGAGRVRVTVLRSGCFGMVVVWVVEGEKQCPPAIMLN